MLPHFGITILKLSWAKNLFSTFKDQAQGLLVCTYWKGWSERVGYTLQVPDGQYDSCERGCPDSRPRGMRFKPSCTHTHPSPKSLILETVTLAITALVGLFLFQQGSSQPILGSQEGPVRIPEPYRYQPSSPPRHRERWRQSHFFFFLHSTLTGSKSQRSPL